MYAKTLSEILHRELSETDSFEDTLTRFEKLRSYRLLPRGRDRAGQRLTDEEIAHAVLGFVPTLSGWAGHVALLMGNLLPVGGSAASFAQANSLKSAMAALLGDDTACKSLLTLTLSIARIPGNDEYQAKLIFTENERQVTTSYVSKYAVSLTKPGAEKTFDHDRVLSTNTRQLVLSRNFFLNLKRQVDVSRHFNAPFETDWSEYETEEELAEFRKKLGARNNSKFLNLGVDTNVSWPKKPTRTQFAGHHLVLFPRTKENSHSISIDLKNERITATEARTLLNRFLSILSWCDDQYAILRDGWSGNPVPVPVPRHDLATMTTQWFFSRALPNDTNLLNCLSYYREGLNAAEAGMASQEVLSFFKVFEMRREGKEVRSWIATVFEEACRPLRPEAMNQFQNDREDKPIEAYVYENCRVAAAHASKKYPSDADDASETRRLSNAAEIVRALARYYIETEFDFSEAYFEDDGNSQPD